MKRLFLVMACLVVGLLMMGFAPPEKERAKEDQLKKWQQQQLPKVDTSDVHKTIFHKKRFLRIDKRHRSERAPEGTVPYTLERTVKGVDDPGPAAVGPDRRPISLPMVKNSPLMMLRKDLEQKKEAIKHPGTLNTPAKKLLKLNNPVILPQKDDGDDPDDDFAPTDDSKPCNTCTDQNLDRKQAIKHPGMLRTPQRTIKQKARERFGMPSREGDNWTDDYTPSSVPGTGNLRKPPEWHPARNPGMLRTPTLSPVEKFRPDLPTPDRYY